MLASFHTRYSLLFYSGDRNNRFVQNVHDVTSQKAIILIFSAMEISNLRI
jgi:hypothetical protein